MKKKFEIIPAKILEGLCKSIVDDGLTGSQIGKAIADVGMIDTNPGDTKWVRLYNSCVNIQNNEHCSNKILKLIQESYHPSRFINESEKFEKKRSDINKQLSFLGYELTEKAQFRLVNKSETVSEAKKRATHLLEILKERNVHEKVFEFCSSELLEDNYFHAVLEACKSVADRIRSMTGLASDGNSLIVNTFNVSNPLIKINRLENESEESEQKGFSNLLTGFFGMFRNTTSHAPRITWEMNEEDAVDMLIMASFIHRRLDRSTIVN